MSDITLPVFMQDAFARKQASKARRAWIAAGIGIFALLLLILFNLPRNGFRTIWKEATSEPSPFEAAKNRTLGFSTIFALTTNTTWRVQGIKAAANLTNIDVELYNARKVPEDEVEAFRMQKEGKEIGRGKALAWLAHLDMVQHIIDEGLETALIIEDDVDWDVYCPGTDVPGRAGLWKQAGSVGRQQESDCCRWRCKVPLWNGVVGSPCMLF
jgi:hypothetical protein